MKAILLQNIKDYPAGTEVEIVDSVCRTNGYFYDCKTPNGEKILIQNFFLKITDKNDYIDWEQRRYEIAKVAMQGILSNQHQVDFALSQADYGDGKHTTPIAFAQYAVACADALIKELKKRSND